jgi:hypothetical protein
MSTLPDTGVSTYIGPVHRLLDTLRPVAEAAIGTPDTAIAAWAERITKVRDTTRAIVEASR